MDTKGLYGKFIIEKADGSALHPLARYFVLNYGLDENGQPFDRHARLALTTYIQSVYDENPELGTELANAYQHPIDAHSHEER